MKRSWIPSFDGMMRCAAIMALFSLLIFWGNANALTSRVLLTGESSEVNLKAASALETILNSLDAKNWASCKSVMTPEGLESLKSLDAGTDLANVNPLYETTLIELPDSGFEVRDIKVMVRKLTLGGNPYQYLVFTLTPDALVSDVRFALTLHQYRTIVQQGDEMRDFAYRHQILQFVEIFRTAYNRKDLEYLRRVYSDDALIIVGRVLKARPNSGGMLERSNLARDRIEFIKQSKTEYLTRLAAVFAENEYIKVDFDEIEIRRHPKFELIYGVTLKQGWKTSSYSDSGWLFLMIDFRDKDQPLIHVRSWQPQKFDDGSVVSLGDFEIID